MMETSKSTCKIPKNFNVSEQFALIILKFEQSGLTKESQRPEKNRS